MLNAIIDELGTGGREGTKGNGREGGREGWGGGRVLISVDFSIPDSFSDFSIIFVRGLLVVQENRTAL